MRGHPEGMRRGVGRADEEEEERGVGLRGVEKWPAHQPLQCSPP